MSQARYYKDRRASVVGIWRVNPDESVELRLPHHSAWHKSACLPHFFRPESTIEISADEGEAITEQPFLTHQ